MKLFVACLVLSLSCSGLADVTSGGKWAADYSETVHIIVNPDQTVTFQYCEGPNNTECRLLGNKPKYKLRDLQRREQLLKKQRMYLILSDATYVAGSALAGLIFVLAAPTPVGAAGIAIYAVSGAAGSGLTIMKSFMDPSNDGALAKIKAPRTLTDHLLMGEAVQVNMPINEFAQQLDTILKGIF